MTKNRCKSINSFDEKSPLKVANTNLMQGERYNKNQIHNKKSHCSGSDSDE
jgi:hypothetical protein